MKPTCKGCNDRTIEPNCHLTCEKYLNYIKQNEKERKARKLAKGEYVTYNTWSYIRKRGH